MEIKLLQTEINKLDIKYHATNKEILYNTQNYYPLQQRQCEIFTSFKPIKAKFKYQTLTCTGESTTPLGVLRYSQ